MEALDISHHTITQSALICLLIACRAVGGGTREQELVALRVAGHWFRDIGGFGILKNRQSRI